MKRIFTAKDAKSAKENNHFDSVTKGSDTFH